MLPAVRLDLRPPGCVDFSSTTMPSSSSWRMTIAANTKRESSSAGGQPDLTLRLRARSALRWPRRARRSAQSITARRECRGRKERT